MLNAVGFTWWDLGGVGALGFFRRAEATEAVLKNSPAFQTWSWIC